MTFGKDLLRANSQKLCFSEMANEVYKTNSRTGQIMCKCISHGVDNEGMKSHGEQLILDIVKGKEFIDDV